MSQERAEQGAAAVIDVCVLVPGPNVCEALQEWRKRMAAVETMDQLSAATLALEGSLAHQLDGLPTKARASFQQHIALHPAV